MKFWPKVWGQGESHEAEKQIAPLERIAAPDSHRLHGGADEPPPHGHQHGENHSETVTPYLSELQGEFTHIEVERTRRSELRYEFFLPEAIPLQVWPSGSAAFATQDPADTEGVACVAGSGVAYRGRAGASRPVFSEVLQPQDDGPDFETRAVAPLTQDDSEPAGVLRARNFFPTWASWQNQKGPEHIHWPGGDGKSFVTSPRGFGPGLAHMAGFWMPAQLPITAGQFLTSYANDVGKDVAPAFYESGKRWPRVGAPSLGSHVDWRHAAVHEAGGRKFFVVSDTHGYFHVYPVANYTSTNPDDWRALEDFKTYLPPYPAWASVPADEVSRSARQREAFLWQFNQDATKVVGVPFNEQEGVAWRVRAAGPGAASADFEPYVIPTSTGTAYFLEPGEVLADYPEATNRRGFWQVPGLVELGLAITVTGEGPLDFEAEFTLLRDSYYDTNGYRYIVDAAYRLRCERLGDDDEATLGAAEDALITAEIELYWDPPATQTRIGRNTANDDGAYEYTDGLGNPQVNFEVHPDLPAYDVRAGVARSQAFGLRNRALVFYTVRDFDSGTVIRRFRLCGKFGNLPNEAVGLHQQGAQNQIGYADLRSLTFMVNSFHSADGTTLSGEVATHVFAWNEHVGTVCTLHGDDAEASMADTEVEEGPPEDTLAMPAEDEENADTAFYWLQLASLYCVRLSFFRAFPVHPRGHWASAPALNHDPEGTLDMIQAYRANGEPMERTSHLAEYNAAFAQERQADFHGAGEVDTDIAPMASAGIWRYT